MSRRKVQRRKEIFIALGGLLMQRITGQIDKMADSRISTNKSFFAETPY